MLTLEFLKTSWLQLPFAGFLPSGPSAAPLQPQVPATLPSSSAATTLVLAAPSARMAFPHAQPGHTVLFHPKPFLGLGLSIPEQQACV